MAAETELIRHDEDFDLEDGLSDESRIRTDHFHAENIAFESDESEYPQFEADTGCAGTCGHHVCAPTEGPPRAVPDPEGRGPHPLVYRGTSTRYSRNPTVGYAQQLLNNFLATNATGFTDCADRSTQRLSYMTGLRERLRRNGQDPLIVDCRFGPSTEDATKIFQACRGLVRDGKIGPITWTHLTRRIAPAPLNPPDTDRCGVPPTSATELEQALDGELLALEQASRRRQIGPHARLSLFQNAADSSHRNHFRCQAIRKSVTIRAHADPRADRCDTRRVGPTEYTTGADIIAAISALHTCHSQRIDAVHVFGHSGSNGLYGPAGATAGLYVAADPASRSAGARSVADVPAANLADNVVIVLHGCNTAAGTDNFARTLYTHLAGTLRNPTVFGHPDSGCAGRDNNWREYSKTNPSGRNRASISPHHTGDGCCTPTTRGEALDNEEPPNISNPLGVHSEEGESDGALERTTPRSLSPGIQNEFVAALFRAMESSPDLSAQILDNPELSHKLLRELLPPGYRNPDSV